MQAGARNHSKDALENARRLRSEMSASEQVLWEFIRKEQLGFTFKRQVPVDIYCLDFYCPESSLCVEVDGDQHASRVELDRERDERLGRLGIYTLMIPSLDLFDKRTILFSMWLVEIEKWCWLRSRNVCVSSTP